MEQQSKIRFLVNFGFTLAVGFIIFICAKFLLGYLLPFVIATVMAWWVQKPARKISDKIKLKRGICAALLSLIIFIATASLIFFIVYRLTLSMGEILGELPQIAESISSILDDLRGRFSNTFYELSPQLSNTFIGMGENILESLGSRLTGFFSSFAAAVAKKTPSFMLSLIVTLVATCYIAKDFDKLVKFLGELCGSKIFGKIIEIKEIFTSSVLKIIKGYAVLTGITFIELLLGLLFLKTEHPLILAFLIALVDLLPVFGTGTVLIPWGLIRIFLRQPSGFFILILYIVITLVRNFIEPKIIGRQIGINPLFTLLVMFAGLRLIGFWGIIIFPLVFIVTFKYYKHQLEIERGEN